MFIVTALTAEAKPLVSALKLIKSNEKSPFHLYASDEHQLVVSGVGKLKSAMGVTWLYSRGGFQRALPACLNIGIAGHSDADVGDCFRVNKIVDADDDSVFYPPQVAANGISGENIRTVSRPDFEYKDKGLVDMEASGFYTAATRFVSGERAALIKVVSDNKKSPAENLNAQLIEQLIGDKLPQACEVINKLQELDEIFEETNQTRDLQMRYEQTFRFTSTQSQQLGVLLDDCLSRDVSGEAIIGLDSKSAKEILLNLKQLRDCAAVL